MKLIHIVFILALAIVPATAWSAFVYGTGCGDNLGVIYLIDTDSGSVSHLFTVPSTSFLGATDGDDGTCFFAIDNSEGLHRVYPGEQTSAWVGEVGMGVSGLAYDSQNGVLYATNYATLFTIDTNTGFASVVGSHGGPDSVWALDFVEPRNQIVGVNSSDNGYYTFDPVTGIATFVGFTGVDRITDVWYDGDNDALYAVANIPGIVYEVDIATGTATTIGTTDATLCGLGWLGVTSTATEKWTWSDLKAMYDH